VSSVRILRRTDAPDEPAWSPAASPLLPHPRTRRRRVPEHRHHDEHRHPTQRAQRHGRIASTSTPAAARRFATRRA
jgi:hypothetical protein